MSIGKSTFVIAIWLVAAAHVAAAVWTGRLWFLVPATVLAYCSIWFRREWRRDELERRIHPLLPRDH